MPNILGFSKETLTLDPLGDFVYDVASPSQSVVQTFALQPSPDEESGCYSYVRLEILGNHGHKHYTCLYRFRVHGELEK